MFALTLFSACSELIQSLQNKMWAPHSLWWAHYLWNVSCSEDWSRSRSNSIYRDGGLLYVSRHARLVRSYTLLLSWEQTRQDYTLRTIIPASFHMCQFCCFMAGMHLNVGGSTKLARLMKDTCMHAQHTHSHTHLRKKGGLWCRHRCNKRWLISMLAEC